MKPIFTDVWVSFTSYDREALKRLVCSIGAQRVLEVGSWMGNGSTRALLEEGVTVFAVDHWLGNPNVGRHQEIVAQFDVFRTFLNNTRQWADHLKPMMMSSSEAASIVADEAFDLVFLDADHSYDEALKDIVQWRPKVRPGGILCGHDCEGRPGDYHREELMANRHLDAISSQRFRHIHPGCILAVDEAFEGQAQLWAERPLELPGEDPGYSTIWWVTC